MALHEEEVFTYDLQKLRACIAGILQRHVSPDCWQWLQEKTMAIKGDKGAQSINLAFTAAPRKTGKNKIILSAPVEEEIQSLRPTLSLQNWTVDRIARVWLLLFVDVEDKDRYIGTIENLFLAGEMHELVALYSALPVLAYPPVWKARCAEGIRSNIGDVLEAIMCDNPYPAENLDTPAWNQLVLKAIFTEKPIHRIVHLDARANQELAHMLSAYAHERWAAHRTVHPLLWRCVGNYIDETILPDIKRIALSENTTEREAAALACKQSNYAPAKELLQNIPELRVVAESEMTWDRLAKKAGN